MECVVWSFEVNLIIFFVLLGENKNSQSPGDKNGKNRSRDSKESGRGGNKKKKMQNKATTAPTITTSMVT